VTTDPPDPDLTGAYVPEPRPDPPPERFAPGTLLAGRYRVVSALGKGGMGEVYRADDLTLGQAVALKFLPPHLATDPDRLARFRREVAAARKVSHPNVCRVYDIAEHEGQPFLTMEFIDGEDLSSMLKRLGRMTEEKGLEIARQLCSALAAVHDQGLLHRDLKPANVMLDGRGKVQLTDFGLAAAAEDLSGSEVRSGTPLYQSPEQLAGSEVTIRSDLYALGLVLYELFTGKRAFAGKQRDTPPSKPSSHVSNLNPAVERVILRCLEPDPLHRPRSATEVLSALPGGDPLAAALAAGETPSPQLVADAGEVGLIKPWVGLLLLGGLLLLIAVVFALSPLTRLHYALPAIVSPADQHRTAEELLDRFGVGPGQDAASGYRPSESHLRLIQARATGSERFPHLRDGRTHVLSYFYRRSPVWLTPNEKGVVVTHETPATNVPGMAGVKLDVSGRLLEFYHTPEPELGPASAGHPVDWAPLLTAAKLDNVTLTPTAPRWTPPVFADQQAAWDVADADGVNYHAEAAALRGQLVWFFLAHQQERPVSETNRPADSLGWILVVFLGSLLLGSGFLAVRNVMRRRVDRRGAAWLVALYLVGMFFRLLGQTRMPLSLWAGMQMVATILGSMVLGGLMTLLFYLALEPVARRRWPWRLSAWSRLVSWQIRDPLVGRDMLVGLSAGVACLVLQALSSLVLFRLAGDPTQSLDRHYSFASGVISSGG
jgi:hypothetical protein